jgi:hypothetical protein
VPSIARHAHRWQLLASLGWAVLPLVVIGVLRRRNRNRKDGGEK